MSVARQGWGTGRIALALYPFGAGAMAVNLFFASLILSWIGLPVLSPTTSIIGGAIFGAPATWAFAAHIRKLMTIADASPARFEGEDGE